MTSVIERQGVVLGLSSLILSEGMTEEHARDVVRASVEAGVAAIDTARSYATVDDDAVGERVAATAHDYDPGTPILTKGGHFRMATSAWGTDGSAQRLRHDAVRSRDILGTVPTLFVLHRADQVDDLSVSVRALAELRDEGLVGAIGISNATVEMLEHAASITTLDAVQNRLGLGVDSLAEYRFCHDAGIDFFAYAPFGGPRAAPLATRVPRVAQLAIARDVSIHRAALAAMMDALPGCWPVIGPTRIESAVDSIAAAHLDVDDELRGAFRDDLRTRDILL